MTVHFCYACHLRCNETKFEATALIRDNRTRVLVLQEKILEMSLALQEPLIENTAVLVALEKCRAEVDKSHDALNEVAFMRDNLAEKQAVFEKVAVQAAMMFEAAQAMSALCAEYHVSFGDFIDLFRTAIRNRNRGKGIGVAGQ